MKKIIAITLSSSLMVGCSALPFSVEQTADLIAGGILIGIAESNNLSPSERKAMSERYGNYVSEKYGITESSSQSYSSNPDWCAQGCSPCGCDVSYADCELVCARE